MKITKYKRACAWLLTVAMLLSMQILPAAASHAADPLSAQTAAQSNGPAAADIDSAEADGPDIPPDIVILSAAAETKVPQNKITATASHFGGSATKGDGPENVLDGDASDPNDGKTVWASWGRSGGDTARNPQWITLELDRAYTVSAVMMTGRSNRNDGFVTKYDLEISADGQTFTNLVTDGTLTPPDSVGTAVRIALPQAEEAKFIRLWAKDNVPYSKDHEKENFWPAISNLDVLVTDGDAGQPEEPETPEDPDEIWPTPVIAPRPVTVTGVEDPAILLNDRTGSGTWQYLFDVPENAYAIAADTDVGAQGKAYDITDDADFDFTAWDGENWENIKVPGEPLMQGHDILAGKEYYYKTTVTIPADYDGNRILLRFDGVYSDARVWVDNQFVRKHVGGFTTWDCDITDLVGELSGADKQISLVVGVTDVRDNPSYASTYAHHNIGGILRDVQLLALPETHLQSLHLETDLDAAFVDAQLKLDVKLAMGGAASAQVKFQLTDPDGTPVALATDTMSFTDQAPTATLSIPIAAPTLWDAEHPNLYELTTTVEVNGSAVQVNTQKVGFREITYGVDDDTYDQNKIYVNGMPVKLRGTCRHDISYDLGRSMTNQQIRTELEAYKAANINFVRTSHYPPNQYFLEVCDELGIYVEDETAVCFQYGANPLGEAAFLDQYTEMIEAHRNHASILMWSLGNESYPRSNKSVFEKKYNYIKATDTTRPVIISWPEELGSWEGTLPYDIYSAHYVSWDLSDGGAGYGKPQNNYDKFPVVHDEYIHVPCYNTAELKRDPGVRNFWGESLLRGWDSIMDGSTREGDGSLGAALWGGIDEVFYIPEGTTERYRFDSEGDVAGYGEWGSVVDVFLRQKPEAWLTQKAYSPIRVEEDNVTAPQAGQPLVLNVENRFDHTNFSEVTLVYQVEGEAGSQMTLASLAPRTEGTISLPARDWAGGDIVNLQFYTNHNTASQLLVDEYNIVVGDRRVPLHQAGEAAPTVTEDGDILTVSGADFTVKFSKSAAQLVEGTYQNELLLSGGPYLNALGGEWTADAAAPLTSEIRGNKAVVTLLGAYGSVGVRFDMEISGNGIIDTQYTLLSAPSKTSGYSEVGICFELAKPVQSVSWQRDGLWSAYPEDHIGRNEGTAVKIRAGSEDNPDVYGQLPQWPWKDDMRNFFLYTKDSESDGLMTNDFKAMRENVWFYDVNFDAAPGAPRVSVESPDASVATRINTEKELNYIDDRDPRVTYSEGNWGPYETSGDYLGTETFSTALGASCEFTFTGTGIRYIGAKQTNTGKVKVYLDGVFQEEIDTYSTLGSNMKQSVIYSKDGLSNEEHTIKLETSGGKANCIVVDAFEVIVPDGDGPTEKTSLVINNQWYFPDLSWGNYTGIPGKLSSGATGSATIVFTDKDRDSLRQIVSLAPVTVSTTAGTAPVLPAKVMATYSDASTAELAVSWDAIDADAYSAPGVFTVRGTVAGTSVGATCTVTVTSGSSGSSPSTPPSDTTTTTEQNRDGSTTKTVTDEKTGQTVATTTYPDGTKIVATTPKDGKTTAVVTLPQGKTSATVTIPLDKEPGPGEVAVLVKPDGTREIVKTSVSTDEGMRVTLTEGATLEIVDNSKTFGDVASGDWFSEAIAFAASRELFNGTGSGSFSPNAPMSRSMLVTVLARFDGQDTEAGEAWDSVGTDWAKENGICDGENMSDSITREQLAVMLYRYAKADQTSADLTNFSDATSVSDWAQEAMQWAVSKGLIGGSNGSLNPGGVATRAEVAAILQRFISL